MGIAQKQDIDPYKKTGVAQVGTHRNMTITNSIVLRAGIPWLSALAFQVAATANFAGHDIRLGLADIVLPCLMLVVLCVDGRWNALTDHSRFPRTWLVWAAVTTVWLTVSLVVGHAALGAWSTWALLNKFVGWFMLLFFLATGWTFARLFPKFMPQFFSAIIVIGWAIALLTLITFFNVTWFDFLIGLVQSNDKRAVGLMVNPNAFGLLVATAAVLQLTGHVQLYGHPRFRILFLAAVLVTLFLTGSRASWLTFGAGLATTALLGRVDWRGFCYSVIVGIIVVAALAILVRNQPSESIYAIEKVQDIVTAVRGLDHLNVPTTNDRIRQFQQAMSLWQQSPIIGIGLGGYRVHGQEIGVTTIHNSYLWLLVETGLVGLLLLGGFFLTLFVLTCRGAHADAMAFLGLCILVMFSVFAIFHEALYQRHIWLIAGMLIAQLSSRGQQLTSSGGEIENRQQEEEGVDKKSPSDAGSTP